MVTRIGMMLALLVHSAAPLLAQATAPTTPPTSAGAAATPTIAGFSFYPIRLYDLSPQGGVFSADLYFWVSLPRKQPPAKSAPKLESANGEELKCEIVEYDPPSSPTTQTFWYRCRSRFYHSFDFTFYPFDQQRLAIRLESPEFSTADFAFRLMPVAHVAECQPNTCVLKAAAYPTVSGWDVSRAVLRTEVHTYATDWGFASYPGLSEYSQAVLEIELLHHWGVPLLALLGPNLLVGLLATLLAGSKQDRSSRMQALLGITAATAAQDYAFMSIAPGESILTFAQSYFLITYGLLGVAGWFILTREEPLPARYQARWLLGYGILVLLCFTVHRAAPLLSHRVPGTI